MSIQTEVSYHLTWDFLQKVPLKALARELDRRGCVCVSKECIDQLVARSQEVSHLESQLRKVAALRIVTEWPGWRGRLARRWISRVEHSLSLLGDPNPGNRKYI